MDDKKRQIKRLIFIHLHKKIQRYYIAGNKTREKPLPTNFYIKIKVFLGICKKEKNKAKKKENPMKMKLTL